MTLRLEKNDHKKLQTMFKNTLPNKEYELETRFGKFYTFNGKTTFSPGIPLNTFKDLLSHFINDSSYEQVPVNDSLCILYQVKNQKGKDEYTQNTKCATGIDTIKMLCKDELYEGEGITHYTKEKRVDLLDIDYFDFRTEVSTEKSVSIDTETLKKSLSRNKMYRYKKRYSFITLSKNFRIDMTITKNAPDKQDRKNEIYGFKNFASSKLMSKEEVYEIEIEYLNEEKDVKKKTKKSTSSKSETDKATNEKINELFKDYFDNVHLILKYIQNTEIVISKNEQEKIFQEYVKNFMPEMSLTLQRNKRNYFLGVDVTSIKLENILPLDEADITIKNIRNRVPEDFSVIEKADGERHLLYISNDGECYMLNQNLDFKKTNVIFQDYKSCLLDGEYIEEESKLLIFDALFINGEDIRGEPLMRTPEERKNNIGNKSRDEQIKRLFVEYEKIKKNLFKKNSKMISLAMKRHRYSFNIDPLILARELWENREKEFSYYVDGLIFTPRKLAYPNVKTDGFRWKNLLKWKPKNVTSIDFLVRTRKDKGKEIEQITMHEDHVTGQKTLEAYKVVYLYVGKRVENRYLPELFIPRVGKEYRKNNDPTYIARIKLEDGKMMAHYPIDGSKEEFFDDMIIECIYDNSQKEGFEWIPIRVRHDKTTMYKKNKSISNTANDISTATNNWNAIHEAGGIIVEENLFSIIDTPEYEKIIVDANREKQSLYDDKQSYYDIDTSKDMATSIAERKKHVTGNIRNFHNTIVKMSLYVNVANAIRKEQDITNLKLLDLGAGKGGDLIKYNKAEITTVYAIDSDLNGLKELYKRSNELKNEGLLFTKNIYTIQANFTQLLSGGHATLNQPDKETMQKFYKEKSFNFFNMVSSQMSFHYACGTELTLRTLIHNVYENLAMNGYFIGTILDGQDVFKKLSKIDMIEEYKDEKLMWQITKKYKDAKFQNFGQEIDVLFTSISSEPKKEYLVNFEYLREVMKEDYDIVIIGEKEANKMGFDDGTGSFKDLYHKLLEKDNPVLLSDEEKEWSFMHRYFIFKKIGIGNSKVIQKWDKLIKK